MTGVFRGSLVGSSGVETFKYFGLLSGILKQFTTTFEVKTITTTLWLEREPQTDGRRKKPGDVSGSFVDLELTALNFKMHF